MPPRLSAHPARLSVLLSAILFLAAIWIVLPPAAPWMLYPAVGIPELSVYVLALAVLIETAVARHLRVSRAARLALVLSSASVALAIVPLAQAGFAVPRLEQAMRDAFGAAVMDDARRPGAAETRTRPIVAADLFRGIDGGEERVTRGIEFASPEGVPLHLDVHTPVAPGTYPAIVQIYGGSWQRGQPGDNSGFSRYFAARGYIVFAIDYRHAPRWRWPAQIDDVRTALAWIRGHGAEYGADVSRIALVGRSAGAHLALLAAYMPGGPPVSGVVSYYGPTDLAAGYREPPSPDPIDIRRVLEAFLGGTPDRAPEVYGDASPVTYATHPQPPTLLVYGGRDHIVLPRFGASLRDRLRATGTPAALLLLPWAEHAFDAVPFGPGAQLALYHTERFLGWALQSADRRSR
ncbi:MAG: alpha/beta hydrolase [Acidobacteriota bacterium]